jgi:hypothetical protein
MDFGTAASLIVGIGGVVAGLAVVGLIRFVRDHVKRTLFLRTAYVGAAIMSLGGCAFIVSRPENLLPFAFRVAFAMFWLLLALRLAVAASVLRPPGDVDR